MENIFNGKHFRNEIDPNLGRSEVISQKISNEIIKNKEITEDKQKEINIIITKEVNSVVALFIKKREELPLFENVLLNKEKLCNKLRMKKSKNY